ncbi:hypothetical protein AOLI_G00020940 [Acnodon oligacanthus]
MQLCPVGKLEPERTVTTRRSPAQRKHCLHLRKWVSSFLLCSAVLCLSNTMEAEDPITAKFQSLVESLMAKTTSEIVKVFAEVLLEIRLEISQSWSGIDELKLEESEEQSTEDDFRSEATVNFKREMEEVLVSDDAVQMPKVTISENTGITQSSVVVHDSETSQTTPSDTSDNNLSVNSPNQTQGGQVSQTVVKRKRGRPAKSSRVTEHQKSTVEVVSKSPLQAISMVSPLQPSCSSSTVASASPNTEALALNTDFLAAEDIQDDETAVDEKGIPGFHHVERLAEYLVELRNLTTMTLTNQQASTIIDLWQNLDTWDKQRIVSVAQNQGRVLTSHFQSTEKETTFTPAWSDDCQFLLRNTDASVSIRLFPRSHSGLPLENSLVGVITRRNQAEKTLFLHLGMEAEDPISAKFQTLIESLMAKTTSEIVKVFAEVLLETRVEISRSWKEIDELKQKLELSEEQRVEAVLRSDTTVGFKGETEEVFVSHESPQIAVSDVSTVCPVDRGSKDVEQISKDTTVKNPEITESSVVVHEPTTSQTTPDVCGVNPSINSPNHTQETQVSQAVVKRKRGRPSKSSKVTELQNAAQTEVLSKLPLQAISVVEPQLPSSSTGIIILSKNRGKRGAVVTRKKYIQKRLAHKSSISATPTLRDRQLLNSQRPCLCCLSDQCSEQAKRLKNNPQVLLQVYTCRKCGNKFYERMQLKGHKCSTVHECNRCGQTFKNLRNLAAHSRSVQSSTKSFPYCCYLCGHMFATQCGWNMHKRIHAHSNLAENPLQDNPKPPQLTLPKELKAKVQVRLERISDAQLEAALCPKNSLLQDEKSSLSSIAMVQNLPSGVEKSSLSSMVQNLPSGGEKSNLNSMAMAPNLPSEVETLTSNMNTNVPSTDRILSVLAPSRESGSQTMTTGILGSRSGPGTNENVKQSDDKMKDSVIPAVSGEIQPTKKESCPKSLTVPIVASEECKEGSSGGSAELTQGFNSLSRKRKMSDCNHDVYNGVFPVEKILRWRNTKGRNEVRVKWMPCSLCGAKWKNTWEPAESFTSYKDSRNEDAK